MDRRRSTRWITEHDGDRRRIDQAALRNQPGSDDLRELEQAEVLESDRILCIPLEVEAGPPGVAGEVGGCAVRRVGHELSNVCVLRAGVARTVILEDEGGLAQYADAERATDLADGTGVRTGANPGTADVGIRTGQTVVAGCAVVTGRVGANAATASIGSTRVAVDTFPVRETRDATGDRYEGASAGVAAIRRTGVAVVAVCVDCTDHSVGEAQPADSAAGRSCIRCDRVTLKAVVAVGGILEAGIPGQVAHAAAEVVRGRSECVVDVARAASKVEAAGQDALVDGHRTRTTYGTPHRDGGVAHEDDAGSLANANSCIEDQNVVEGDPAAGQAGGLVPDVPDDRILDDREPGIVVDRIVATVGDDRSSDQLRARSGVQMERVAVDTTRLGSAAVACEPAVLHQQIVVGAEVLASDARSREEASRDVVVTATAAVEHLARVVGEDAVDDVAVVVVEEPHDHRSRMARHGAVTGTGQEDPLVVRGPAAAVIDSTPRRRVVLRILRQRHRRWSVGREEEDRVSLATDGLYAAVIDRDDGSVAGCAAVDHDQRSRVDRQRVRARADVAGHVDHAVRGIPGQVRTG